MNRILTALVCMDPEQLTSAADELENLRNNVSALPNKQELMRMRQLALASAEHWRQIVSLTALQCAGYSASGEPVAPCRIEGAVHG